MLGKSGQNYCIIVVSLLVVLPLSSIASMGEETASVLADTDEGWCFLPAYPNYAPQGLPDFDQRAQHDWKSMIFVWSLCAPTSLADILWYFDSKHADPSGVPGDGADTYPLVTDFQPPCSPVPGPYSDDHCFTNVNDQNTSLKQWTAQGELIEQIAWYVNHDFRRFPPLSFLTAGTRQHMMKWGIEQWLKDTGLREQYTVEHYFKPRFETVYEAVQNNAGVVLLLRFYNPISKLFPIGNGHHLISVISGHYVAVAGVHPDGFIALSDPYLNVENPEPTPVEHCDPQIVSHDRYAVSHNSPASFFGTWWLPNYWHTGGIASYALIITPN